MLRPISGDRFERWAYLLSRDQSKWGKITPIDVWPLADVSASHPDMPVAELLNSGPLRQYRDLRCGHSSFPGVQTMSLCDALLPESTWSVPEGFICVLPSKITVAINHEGGLYVYGV